MNNLSTGSVTNLLTGWFNDLRAKHATTWGQTHSNNLSAFVGELFEYVDHFMGLVIKGLITMNLIWFFRAIRF